MRRSLRWTLTKCRAHDVYRPGERPAVEALVDGEWRPGELRAWTQHDEEARTFDVQYQPAGNSRTIGTFTVEEIREDTVDRAEGRSELA